MFLATFEYIYVIGYNKEGGKGERKAVLVVGHGGGAWADDERAATEAWEARGRESDDGRKAGKHRLPTVPVT